jgi:transposase InsO family protein
MMETEGYQILYHFYLGNGRLSNPILQLVLPAGSQQVEAILYKHHNQFYAGHLGIDRLAGILKRQFYWTGMLAHISRYVKGCTHCARAKRNVHPCRPDLQLRVQNLKPFSHLHIDALGLKKTPNGYTNLLVIVDYYSKFVIAWPSVTVTCQEVALQLLDKVIYRFGTPVQITSDNGSCFKAGLYNEVLKLLGVKRQLTASFNPRSNGLCERVHGTIIESLRTFIAEDHNKWVELVNPICFCLNNSPQGSTGISAHATLHGWPSVWPEETQLPEVTGVPRTHREVFSEILSTHHFMRAYMEKTLKAYQERYKHYYDRKNSRGDSSQFIEGAIVYVKTPQISTKHEKHKLKSPYVGPNVIIRRSGGVAWLKGYENNKEGKRPLPIHLFKLGSVYDHEFPRTPDIDLDELFPEEEADDNGTQGQSDEPEEAPQDGRPDATQIQSQEPVIPEPIRQRKTKRVIQKPAQNPEPTPVDETISLNPEPTPIDETRPPNQETIPVQVQDSVIPEPRPLRVTRRPMRFRSEPLTSEQEADRTQVPEPNQSQEPVNTEPGHHRKAKQVKTYATTRGAVPQASTGKADPSRVPKVVTQPTPRIMAATKSGPEGTDPFYHPIKKIVNATRDSSGVRVRVEFQDGETQWVDFDWLNRMARDQYDAQGIVPTDGPRLRRR